MWPSPPPPPPSGDPCDRYWARLTDYFGGQCSETERRAIERWIAADPQRAADVAGIRTVWQTLRDRTFAQPAPDQRAVAARRLLRKMREADLTRAGRQPDADRARRPVGRALTMSRSAASPIAVAAAAVIGVAVLVSVNRHRHAPADIDRTLITSSAQWSTARLPDGTTVTLGPESRLHFTSAALGGARTVDLVGQAQFIVAHDTTRTFVVQAGGVVTTDIGTTFTVSAYPDKSTWVAVRTGSVRVEAGRLRGKLTAGQQSVFDAPHDQLLVRAADSADAFGWTTGALTVRHAQLSDVVREMHRLYGMTITLHDAELAARRVTVSIPAGTDPQTAIELLRTAADALRLRGTAGDSVTFYANRAVTPAAR